LDESGSASAPEAFLVGTWFPLRRYVVPTVPGIRGMWRWLRRLPLGTQLYFAFWTVLVPAGVALVVIGATVPGLILLVLFLFDQAVFTPLFAARARRRRSD
jgi:hypothetical protein